MKWVMKDPSRGDMIRVESGSIYHFGIYVSDEEVIQFGLAPSQRSVLKDSEVVVLASDIDRFLAGGFLEVCEFDRKERKKNRTPDEVVNYARSKLGMGGYNIIYNNCEHFANECISGQHICKQADDVRAMFRNMPIVDVYVANIPDREIEEPLSCSLRQKEIEAISNISVKREKYFVWQLLAYGIERSFGFKIADLEFKKGQNGVYCCDKVHFSLSHSKNILAVAVSRGDVGVDIELFDSRCNSNMAERVMNEDEYAVYEGLSESEKQNHFIKLWTAKEALFKKSHGNSFNPADWDTNTDKCRSFEKNLNGVDYSLSVATVNPERIRIFENIKL